MAKRRAAAAVLGKAAARFVPGLGWLLLAYDLYRWLNQQQATASGVRCNTSIASCDLGFWQYDQFSAVASCTPKCNGALKPSGPLRAQIQVGLTGWIARYHTVFNQQRYALEAGYQYPVGTWVRTGPVPRLGVTQAPGRRVLPHEQPEFQPWLDPSLPPQMQPRRRPNTGFKPNPNYRLPPYHPAYIPPGDPIELPQYDPDRPWSPPIRQEPDPKRERRLRRRYRRRAPWTPQPKRDPRTKPRLPPYMDPLPRPKVPVPQPLVDPLPDPRTIPQPGVAPAPGTAPFPYPGPGPVPAPQTPPGWQIEVKPEPGVSPPQLRPGPPANRPVTPPPGPKGKETKLGANRAGLGWLMWLFNFTTEARDFIDAAYKALPCSARSRSDNTPAKKMDTIYDNFDQIDWNAAASELFLNQVEDYIVGRTHAAISKGFGSGESWANYMRQIGMDKTTGFGETLGRDVNNVLDEVASRMGLPRIKCGRR